MFLTEAEIHCTESQQEESEMVRSSCLRATRSVTTIIVGDTDLKEHSDDEWYPPTPPLYDVTDKLR